MDSAQTSKLKNGTVPPHRWLRELVAIEANALSLRQHETQQQRELREASDALQGAALRYATAKLKIVPGDANASTDNAKALAQKTALDLARQHVGTQPQPSPAP